MDKKYEIIKERFSITEKLYHYTTFESACKIIVSKKLKYGRLNDMNDINEAYRRGFWEMKLKLTQESIDKAISNYKQISFSIDKDGIMGFDIPAMWGHYANKGKGVCLVFDKKIIDEIVYNEQNSDIHPVDYNLETSDIFVDTPDVDELMWNYRKEFFFKKTQDWSYEQEYRVITKGSNEYLEFGENAIIAVILCYEPVEAKVLELIIGTKRIPIVNYSYHDFFSSGQSALTHIHGDYTLFPARNVIYDF